MAVATNEMTSSEDLIRKQFKVLKKHCKIIDISYASLIDRFQFSGEVCHVGSLINKPNITEQEVLDWRNQFSRVSKKFTGIDLFPGSNVDITANICDVDFAKKHPDLKNKFGLIICRALLEHVENPFTAAENISFMCTKGGHLAFSGPWVWGYHPYPDDYWRLSFSALRVLFPDFEFLSKWYESEYLSTGIEIKDQKYERKIFKQYFNSLGPFGKYTNSYMPYINLGAIAEKNS